MSDALEAEWLERKKRKDGFIKPLSMLSDEELQEIINARKSRKRIKRVKDKVKDIAAKGTEAIKTRGKSLGLIGDLIGGGASPTPMPSGSVVARCPSTMRCTKCKLDYPLGTKCFKRGSSYLCPRCGEQLQPIESKHIWDNIGRR